MIFLFAGTKDARGLVDFLLKENLKIMASVVTDYGKILLEGNENLVINQQRLDEVAMEETFRKNNISVVVDASHPYAVNVSNTAINVAKKLSIPYIRYEREVTPIPKSEKIHLVASYEEAAELAMTLGECIFLTTGSNRLELFSKESRKSGKRIIPRVLPADYSIEICNKCNITPKDIVAIQGPFSKELNKELYKKYDADVVVMKNSGTLGGTETKLTAALEMDMEIVIIDRPQINYTNMVHNYEEVLKFIKRGGTWNL